MIVVFRTNVGIADAGECGLSHTDCQAGMSLDAPAELAQKLMARGYIHPVEIRAVPPVAELTAVPPEPEDGTVEKATQDLITYKRKAKRVRREQE